MCCASGLLHLLRLCWWFAKLSHPYNLHVSFRYVPVWIFSNIVKYIPFVFRILGSPLWLQQINFSCTCKNPSSTDYFSVPCTTTCRWSTDSRETFVCACMVHVTISVCRCLHCDSIWLIGVSIAAYSLADSFISIKPPIPRRLGWECTVVNSYVVRCHLIPFMDRKLHNTLENLQPARLQRFIVLVVPLPLVIINCWTYISII